MTTLFYKGIEFDDWTADEYGYWANICPKCAEKYADALGVEFKESDFSEYEVCSIKSCWHNWDLDWELDSLDVGTAYIDFDMSHVVLKTLVQ